MQKLIRDDDGVGKAGLFRREVLSDRIGTRHDVFYRMNELICDSGMGKIYKATQIVTSDGKPVAERAVRLKVMEDPSYSEEARERFASAARLASELKHPNIVETIHFGQTDDGKPFMVLDCAIGTDMRYVLEHDGPMRWNVLAPITLEVCEALQALHGHTEKSVVKELVHLDVKPENIILAEVDGKITAKLTGFELLCISERGLAGSICGTPEYMAPEQALGRKTDNRTDIYGLGSVIYEMLTGKTPFERNFDNGPTQAWMEIGLKIIHEQVIPPKKAAPKRNILKDVDDIVMKCLAKDPKDRYQSVGELMADIRKTL